MPGELKKGQLRLEGERAPANPMVLIEEEGEVTEAWTPK
jgi:hypothetical protein